MRKIILMLVIAVVAASLAGAQEVTKLTLNIDSTTSTAGINAVIAAAEAKLGISVEFDQRPTPPEGENVLQTRLAAGDMDDLVYYASGAQLQKMNPLQNFVDLTHEPFMADVIDSFKLADSVGGKVFGIPFRGVEGGGWLYNKKVYAQLGLKVPKTWNELMANCEKIKRAGKVAVIGSYKDDWTAQVVFLAEYYNTQVQDPSFAADFTAHKAGFANTPAALRGFEKLQEIYKKGYLNKDALATTYDGAQKMLLDGDGAHYVMVTFVLPNLVAIDPAKANDIGFFAQPGDKASSNGLTVWMPDALYIYKNSKNIDAAKKFLAFFVSREGIAAYMTGDPPMGPSAVKGISLPSNVLPAVKDLLPYINAGQTAPALEFLSPIKGPNCPQITAACGVGLMSPAEAAKTYDQDCEKQAKQLGLPGW